MVNSPLNVSQACIDLPKFLEQMIAKFRGQIANRKQFSILDFVQKPRRKASGNYYTQCPSCAQAGNDRAGDNLAISISDSRKYKCWAGCTKEMIRAAVGQPIPT